MAKIQATFLLVLISLVLGTSIAEVPKPSYARTMLKVSRSLPGETEELKVRTSEGSVATLIVKRRDKLFDATKSNHSVNSPEENQKNVQERYENITLEEDPKSNSSEIKRKDEVRKLEEAQIKQLRATLSDFEGQRNLEEGTSVGENERVTVSRDDRTISEKNIDYGNWTPLGKDGRALKLEESTTEEYRDWKPLQTDLKETTEEMTNYGQFSEPSYPNGGLLLLRNFQDRSQRKLEVNERGDEKNTRYTFLPHQIRSSRTNIGANSSKNRDAKNVPPEVIVRSEINVKSTPKRSAMSLDRDGTPVIHGKRVPDEPMDKFQTWRNSRVINNKLVYEGTTSSTLEPSTNFYPVDNLAEKQRFERFFKTVNRRYGRDFDEEGRNVFFEWDPKNYKSETLKADVYEPRNDNYRASVHKRMLHPDGITTYPNSQLYTPESQKIAPVALKPGARAPVLQYAHPELGVQPAKIVKNEKRRPDNFPENQHSFTEQRQKKKYVLNDKNIVDSYTTKNYYPNQHFYGLKRPNDAPFWVKISENLKHQFSNSVEKVSQFTRPVIDPLVEATHKISQNLGLSKGKEAQDKIGTVASGTSILIPALGLVASGAALGIGAVAVGRYLDVDVLKRSKDSGDVELEHERALKIAEPFLKNYADGHNESDESKRVEVPGGNLYLLENIGERGNIKVNDGASSVGGENKVYLILEDDQKRLANLEAVPIIQEREDFAQHGRSKRSVDYLDIFNAEGDLKGLIRNKRLQRKGADSISEIVEIDLPAREGNIEVTEFLIPRKNMGEKSNEMSEKKDNAILVIEDDSTSLKYTQKDIEEDVSNQKILKNVARIFAGVIGEEAPRNSLEGRTERRRRNIESDQELDDALQNLENAEVAEVAHIDADWTNTPCAKRIFCDVMVQRGQDAVVFMEKKMAALLGLIQPGAAVQVSSHFEEVMDAVRKHDCSNFLCPQARPGNVFF